MKLLTNVCYSQSVIPINDNSLTPRNDLPLKQQLDRLFYLSVKLDNRAAGQL
jgi:hypothetical protein